MRTSTDSEFNSTTLAQGKHGGTTDRRTVAGSGEMFGRDDSFTENYF